VGLGLGLHISRAIIERPGGRVDIESEKGAGSMFCFSLPLAGQRQAEARPMLFMI
jgi:K+-sensing histidine kinase KdpD